MESVQARGRLGTPGAGRLPRGSDRPGGEASRAQRGSTSQATVRRSKWLGWLLGRTETVEATVRTPRAELVETMVYPDLGRAGDGAIQPAREGRHGADGRTAAGPASPCRSPRRVVPIGPTADAAHSAGTALVAGVPRSWERLPAAVRVSWFPPGPEPHVLVRPALDSALAPSAPIVLTFSRPVADILGPDRPLFRPRVRGAWHQPNDHTLVFQPAGLGFPLGRRVHLRLPRQIEVISGSRPGAVHDAHLAGPARLAPADAPDAGRPRLPPASVHRHGGRRRRRLSSARPSSRPTGPSSGGTTRRRRL